MHPRWRNPLLSKLLWGGALGLPFAARAQDEGWAHVAATAQDLIHDLSLPADCRPAAEGLAEPEPLPDTSVEVETRTLGKLERFFTTKTGRVDGVLARVALPKDYLEWAARERPRLSPEHVAWDEVPLPLRESLLRKASKDQRQEFFADRRLPGLVLKPTVRLHFAKPTRLFGVKYPAGEQIVNLRSFLGDRVEYGTNKMDPSHVELHLRGNLSAGDMSYGARQFLDVLGLPQTHQHVHIVNKLPIAFLRADPRHPLMLVDHFRRVNLAAEMIGVVEDGLRVQTVPMSFDHLNRYMLELALKFWKQLAKSGTADPLESELKLSWIGLHSPEKYDDKGRFGYQVRSIAKQSDPELHGRFLDEMQRTLRTMDFGEAGEAFKRWADAQPPRVLERHLLRLCYESTFGGRDLPLDDPPPAAVQKFFHLDWSKRYPGEREFREASPLAARFAELASVDHDLKMLIHDWSRDPLFFEDAGLQRRIVDEQLKALTAITGGESIATVMPRFLRDSGLYRRVLASVGL